MAHPLDDGKRRLRKLVARGQEAEPRLPLVHSTDTYLFEDALTAGFIEPQPCSVFGGESLIYLFSGRPSYRPNMSSDPTALGHYFPVSIIFKPDWSPVIKRMFPFDSGAFRAGLYSAYVHDRMKLGDFSLDPDPSTPGRLISLFFGDVPSYLMARPRTESAFDPSEFEAESYLALINARDGNAVDSRGSGLEVQVEDEIDIKAAVAAVVLPSRFAEGATGKRLKHLGIDVIPYRVYDRTRPNEYTSTISDLCINYLVRIKLINESDL